MPFNTSFYYDWQARGAKSCCRQLCQILLLLLQREVSADTMFGHRGVELSWSSPSKDSSWSLLTETDASCMCISADENELMLQDVGTLMWLHSCNTSRRRNTETLKNILLRPGRSENLALIVGATFLPSQDALPVTTSAMKAANNFYRPNRLRKHAIHPLTCLQLAGFGPRCL